MKISSWTLVFLAWLIAAMSTLGALFLGEVVGLTPCVLCWYQRICLFPLALILPVGLFPFDRKIVRYALPLAAIGLAIATFHMLLAGGIIPEHMAPCTQTVPCTKEQIVWFGFLTLPMLSAAAFLSVNVLLVLTYFKESK
jgi:disulfide bond formation protein DsbB